MFYREDGPKGLTVGKIEQLMTTGKGPRNLLDVAESNYKITLKRLKQANLKSDSKKQRGDDIND